MDLQIKEKFLTNWKKYFGRSELPIVCFYDDNPETAERAKPSGKGFCFIGDLIAVRKGKSLMFNEASIGCEGAKGYLWKIDKVMPDFEYFLSCGIPGKMEGERFIRTPELVRDLMKREKQLPFRGENVVFKRWDKLTETDNPDIVIFFAKPDVLSGLFTLANFDQSEPNTSICPFGSGCGSIIYYPYLEKDAERPRALIGMFDISARPFVSADTLTFSVPMVKFVKMIDFMDESFLITESWKKVLKRINKVR